MDDGDDIGTNGDCTDDAHGCFAISFGVVSQDYMTYDGYETDTFSSEVKYNYDVGFFVVEGESTSTGATLTPMEIDFTNGMSRYSEGYALGYPGDYDPGFMYSKGEIQSSPIVADSYYIDCGTLGEGASGGPWVQHTLTHVGWSPAVLCIHSWKWSSDDDTATGIGCAPLHTGFAECLHDEAISAAIDSESMVVDC